MTSELGSLVAAYIIILCAMRFLEVAFRVTGVVGTHLIDAAERAIRDQQMRIAIRREARAEVAPCEQPEGKGTELA